MSQTQGPCSKPPREFTVRIRSPTKCFPFKWLSQTVDHTVPSQEESTTTSNIRLQIHERRERQEIPCSTIIISKA